MADKKPKKKLAKLAEWDLDNYSVRAEINRAVKAWLDEDADRVLVLLGDNRKKLRKLYGPPYDIDKEKTVVFIVKNEQERAEFIIYADESGTSYEVIGDVEYCLYHGPQIVEFLKGIYENLRAMQ